MEELIMTDLTTKLFLDVKKFETYQNLLKKNVHLQSQSIISSPDFPNKHIYNKLLRTLDKNSNEVTSADLLNKYNFRMSEIQDGIKALLSTNLISKEDLSNTECKIILTKEGIAAANQLAKRSEKIAEEAYGILSQEEQQQLDNLILKLTEDYKHRSVNYSALADLNN